MNNIYRKIKNCEMEEMENLMENLMPDSQLKEIRKKISELNIPDFIQLDCLDERIVKIITKSIWDNLLEENTKLKGEIEMLEMTRNKQNDILLQEIERLKAELEYSRHRRISMLLMQR